MNSMYSQIIHLFDLMRRVAWLRANTVKTRTHSLFNQGLYFYGAIPNMKIEKFRPLMKKFAELLCEQPTSFLGGYRR